MFRGPSSLANTPVIPSTPAFDAAYTEEFGVSSELATEPKLMMLPPAPMCFTASFVVSRRPRTGRRSRGVGDLTRCQEGCALPCVDALSGRGRQGPDGTRNLGVNRTM